jgi:hypothetical protein
VGGGGGGQRELEEAYESKNLLNIA